MEINCPVCKKKLLKVKSNKNQIFKIACRRCMRWIWINPVTGKSEVKQIPKRTTASGMRFY